MKSGFSLGKVFGISIHIDWSWLLIFALISWSLASAFHGVHAEWSLPTYWGLGMLAAVLFFLSVLAHELAHAVLARAMGIHGRRVEDPGELPGAISELLAHDGPAVLDVVTAKQELSMPPTIGLEQVKGFSVWLIRAVMSGRGDEVVDLARENLLPR